MKPRDCTYAAYVLGREYVIGDHSISYDLMKGHQKRRFTLLNAVRGAARAALAAARMSAEDWDAAHAALDAQRDQEAATLQEERARAEENAQRRAAYEAALSLEREHQGKPLWRRLFAAPGRVLFPLPSQRLLLAPVSTLRRNPKIVPVDWAARHAALEAASALDVHAALDAYAALLDKFHARWNERP